MPKNARNCHSLVCSNTVKARLAMMAPASVSKTNSSTLGPLWGVIVLPTSRMYIACHRIWLVGAIQVSCRQTCRVPPATLYTSLYSMYMLINFISKNIKTVEIPETIYIFVSICMKKYIQCEKTLFLCRIVLSFYESKRSVLRKKSAYLFFEISDMGKSLFRTNKPCKSLFKSYSHLSRIQSERSYMGHNQRLISLYREKSPLKTSKSFWAKKQFFFVFGARTQTAPMHFF